MIEFLLANGASLTKKNQRGEAAVDTVSGQWSSGLRQFYEGVIGGSNLDLNIDSIQQRRPKVAVLLREKSSRRGR